MMIGLTLGLLVACAVIDTRPWGDWAKFAGSLVVIAAYVIVAKRLGLG